MECLTYLAAACLQGSLASLVAPADGNWRRLICDDASTGDSVSRALGRGDQIRLLGNGRNRGCTATLRRLIDAATTAAVGMLDAGDMLAPEAMAVVRDPILRSPPPRRIAAGRI